MLCVNFSFFIITVDLSEILRSSVEVGSFCHHLPGILNKDIYLEPDSQFLSQWLFQLAGSKSLHRKWLYGWSCLEFQVRNLYEYFRSVGFSGTPNNGTPWALYTPSFESLKIWEWHGHSM